MIIGHSSANPTESDSAWEAYKRLMNSKISNLKNFMYKVFDRNFHYGFIPLMEIWKLRNSQLCLPAPEVKEAIQEVMEDVVVQDVVVISGHQDCIMEEASTQIVVFETQQVEAFVSQPSAGTSSGDNALVKEHLDK